MNAKRTVIKSKTFPTPEIVADWFFVPVAQAAEMLDETRAFGATWTREIAIGPVSHMVELDSNGIEMFTNA